MKRTSFIIVLLLCSCARRNATPTTVVREAKFVREISTEGVLDAEKATPITAPIESPQALKVAWLADDGTRLAKGDPVVRFDATDFNDMLRAGRDDATTTGNKLAKSSVESGATRANLQRDARVALMEVESARQFMVNDDEVFSRYQRVESTLDGRLAEERRDYAEDVLGVREALARADRDLLDIEARKSELKVSTAERGLNSLEVRAPHDGLFVLRRVGNDTTRVGSTVWPGMKIGDIPDLKRLKAEIFVLEADAAGLAIGKRARIMLESHPARVFTGKVTRIDKLARPRMRNVPVQYFGATVTLDQSDATMKPGARVQAMLELDDLEHALVVPRQAVFERDGRRIVYVKRGAHFRATPVETGSSTAGRIVITKGLAAGDEVALADPAAKDGDA